MAALPAIRNTDEQRKATGFTAHVDELLLRHKRLGLTKDIRDVALEYDTAAKLLAQQAEAKRVELKAPILEAARRHDAYWTGEVIKPVTDRRALLQRHILIPWQMEQDRKAKAERLERERLAREQAEAQRKAEADALMAEAAATNDESLVEEAIRVEATPIVPTLVPVVEVEKLNGATVRMVKVGKVTNPAMLLAFLLGGDVGVNLARLDLINEILGDPAGWKVNAAIRRGLDLPGVEVHDEPAFANRSR